MRGDHQVEDGGAGSERIHPRQSKDRSLWNTVQGSGGRDSGGETVCTEAVGGGCFERGKMRKYRDVWRFPFYGNCAWS